MKRMSIQKRFSVTMRGFVILKQYCPNLAQGKALYELIRSLQPFISVWFTAQIINELSTHRRIKTVMAYVLSVIVIHFICAVLKSIIERVCNEKEAQMWSWFGKIFSDKQISLDQGYVFMFFNILLILLIWKMRTSSISGKKRRKISICLAMV